MNFLQGRANGGNLEMPGGTVIRLFGGLPPALAGREIWVGVRPEHLDICPEADAAFVAEVEMIEQLGADTLAHCSLAGGMIVARLPLGSEAKAGDRLPLRQQTGQLHFFDGASGARL